MSAPHSRSRLGFSSIALGLAVSCVAGPAAADDWTPATDFQVDAHLTLMRFEQQVKLEVGDEAGEPLVRDSMFGVLTTATWRPWAHVQIGWFARLHTGSLLAARFAGEDDEGRTVVDGRIAGDFTEFWTGPLLRADWRGLFLELGYGAFGVRADDARSDLPDADGSTASAFRTSSTVAMIAGLGGQINVWSQLDVILRLQYRVRYYDRRGDVDLLGGRAHGSQDYTPFIGVGWRFESE